MGVIFKSTIGLGVVYFAMFGTALKPGEVASTAALCASAAQAQIVGEATLHGQWAGAGCAIELGAQAERVIAPVAAPTGRATPAAPPAKSVAGSLTENDLREPWFGPGPLQRKAAQRG